MTVAQNSENAASLRSEVERAVREGDFAYALHVAETLWFQSPLLTTAGFLKGALAPVAQAFAFPLKRISLFKSYTVEPLLPLIEALGLLGRHVLDVRVGGYNTYIQDLMAAPADADAVLIALHTRTAAPAIWEGISSDAMRRDGEWLCENIGKALASYRNRGAAPILLQILDNPPNPRSPDQEKWLQDTNARILKIAADVPDCHTFEISDIADQAGARWFDERNWAIAKIPFRNEFAGNVATRIMQNVRAVIASSLKVLVVDLDNTLWGGVLGEDGEDALKLSVDSGYQSIHNALLALKNRGVLLGIASKNDHAMALATLTKHPDCLLRPADFADMRINWQRKSENIRAMAEELGLGLDAFAFLDDNPAERAEVARALPMVRVLPHFANPAVMAEILTAHPEFMRVNIGGEDGRRTELYAARRARMSAETEAGSRDDFISSLQQVVILEGESDEMFARSAELERKTNQFNVRTRRFSESELRNFACAASSYVRAFRVLDQFGDNGVVGLAVASINGNVATIESFLMSCRVIGRDVELYMLRDVAGEAIRCGCSQLRGAFSQTLKNAPAANFFRDAGFAFENSRDSIEYWRLDLNELSEDWHEVAAF